MVSQQTVRLEGVSSERSKSLLDPARTRLYATDNI